MWLARPDVGFLIMCHCRVLLKERFGTESARASYRLLFGWLPDQDGCCGFRSLSIRFWNQLQLLCLFGCPPRWPSDWFAFILPAFKSGDHRRYLYQHSPSNCGVNLASMIAWSSLMERCDSGGVYSYKLSIIQRNNSGSFWNISFLIYNWLDKYRHCNFLEQSNHKHSYIL